MTGAPGSGKTTVTRTLLEGTAPYVLFDIDWLADPVSQLVGKDIRFAPETWGAYGEVWFAVLYAVLQNGLTPVLFTPADPDDFAEKPLPGWCRGLEWLLLDCDDETRRARLRARGWSGARLDEAMGDARALRQQVPTRLDTGKATPGETAVQVLAWLERLG